MNVRDAFYEVLRTHGITTIFGNPVLTSCRC
jgi:thiamine pyrophosphate-dependent acetolactate synthase large subunit-like protein